MKLLTNRSPFGAFILIVDMLTPDEVQQHRSIHPLGIEEITLYSSFEQILGKKSSDYTPEERKQRWLRNGELLKKVEPKQYNFWFTDSGSDETCLGCAHRYEGENWCRWSELPCNYNPILKNFGMACMGIGRENQQELKFK